MIEYLETLITLRTRIIEGDNDYLRKIDARIEKICKKIDDDYGIK